MVGVVFCVVSLFILNCAAQVRYDPNWESLDKRPLPKWYDEAKFGIFLHWGVYSVPSFGSEWFWNNWKGGSKETVSFMKQNYPPNFTYQDFAKDFTAQHFDPNAWAKLFAKAGARYVVLTGKHHEGYTLWPSAYSFSWNARDVGPNKDLLGELAVAVRATSLKFGVYHSLYEWYNPLYLSDKKSNFTKNNFVSQKIIPELVELVQNYKPEVIWSDGDWEATDIYWKSTDFLAWLYNESPVKDTVVVNDRWGIGTSCRHGDFYNCKDKYNPGVLQPHKWENAMTVDKSSWGYRRNVNYEDFHTVKELIEVLVQTVSCGGNLLMNVGPTSDGRIDPIFQDRLINFGRWLSINGPAIYGTKPWTYQKDSVAPVWYTSSKSLVYAIVLDWPPGNTLSLVSGVSAFKSNVTKVNLLGNPENLHWEFVNNTVSIQFPDKATVKCDWSWSLQIQNGATNEVNDHYYN